MCINKANDEGVYTKRCRRYFFNRVKLRSSCSVMSKYRSGLRISAISFISVSNYSLAVIRNKYHTHFLGSVHKDAARPL